jgi:hypothetical protein
MKTLIFALIVLVVAGAAVLHYYPEQAEPLLAGTPLNGLVATSKPVYQWQDEQGQWHVTDKPPREGIPYEVKQYALDANVLPPFEQDKN